MTHFNNPSRLKNWTAELDTDQKATAAVAFAAVNDSFFTNDPIGSFAARGHERFLPHIKSAINAISVEDANVALQPITAAFSGLVDRQSISGRLLSLGAVSFALNGGARLQVGELVATETAEGESKAIARLDFDAAGPPRKVQAGIIASAESLRALDERTQAGIRDVLVSATAAALDVVIVNVLTAASPVGSPVDVATVFAACSGGAPAAPVLIAGLDVLLALDAGVTANLQALGIAIVSTPAAAGKMIALDARGLLIALNDVAISTARHASVTLDDGSSPASTNVVNLWQANLAALRAERFVRTAVRRGAVAWGTV